MQRLLFSWVKIPSGALRVEYSWIAGACVLDLSGLSNECGLSVSWRDLAPSDRAAVRALMAELREAA